MKNNSKDIPKFLHRYFWDIEPDKLDLRRHSSYVIGRLLGQNDLKTLKWTLNNFPQNQIVEVIKNRRGLSPKDANFWRLYFNIPQEEVKCLQRLSPQQHVKIWKH